MITHTNHNAAEHKMRVSELSAFLGKWHIEGKNFSAKETEAADLVHGKDHYEWLDGEFFIQNRWQHLSSAGNDHKGISLLGYDPEKGIFYSHNFDNLGFERRYELVNDGYTWKFIGTNERAIRVFDKDGSAYTENWEVLSGDDEWIPLCTMTGKKVNVL